MRGQAESNAFLKSRYTIKLFDQRLITCIRPRAFGINWIFSSEAKLLLVYIYTDEYLVIDKSLEDF